MRNVAGKRVKIIILGFRRGPITYLVKERGQARTRVQG